MNFALVLFLLLVATGAVWLSESATSPVPGGMSTMR